MENEFRGGTFTFASLYKPTQSAGVFGNSTEFGVSVLNRSKIMLYVYGGNYANSGTKLYLEKVFPVQFPFGIEGPKMTRPTQISEMACMRLYLHLSLPQFMRGNFILVVFHLYNRATSYKSGLVT